MNKKLLWLIPIGILLLLAVLFSTGVIKTAFITGECGDEYQKMYKSETEILSCSSNDDCQNFLSSVTKDNYNTRCKNSACEVLFPSCAIGD